MKASEVLKRYAAGERDFRRTNLRGQSFKGQDLSGADFNEADIRGTNFTNATLKGVNFTGANAGLQRRWALGQWVLLLVLSDLAGVLQGYFGYFIAVFFPRWWDASYDWRYFATDVATTVAYLITIMAAFVAIARQGFTMRAFGSVAVAVAGASFLLGIYCSRRALSGDEKFALIRTFGIFFGAIGGTSFCGANLTGANFTKATLKSTNFNPSKQAPTILTHVCWQEAKKLGYARVGSSILSNPAVRELLVTRNGYKNPMSMPTCGGQT
ncbi:MAG: hypothetical protein HC866_07300 [Leptolyngbyaceae cyanobacterium RU_5_1]|nr:hypothetical protein [Leptolyngbyaceae cyanobacterium RU_5_1]